MAAIKSMIDENDEQVRSKPMIVRPPSYGNSQEGHHEVPAQPITPAINHRSNFDVLLIGHTGYGKSTTADKLMVPNSQALQEHRETQIRATRGPNSLTVSERHQPSESRDRASAVRAHPQRSQSDFDDQSFYIVEEPSEHRSKVQSENLTGWVLSADRQESINTETRLKNIVFCRTTRRDCEPHIHIQKFRRDPAFERAYSSTKSCQLITNDDSKIRVLDAPGFFSPDLMEGATNEQESNLAIVRHIVRIQAIADLNFKRVLYFLPVRGELKRADRTINKELQELIKFFGASAFKNMVLVATTVDVLSENPDIQSEAKFPHQQLETSRTNFNIALRNECQRRGVNIEGLPPPPIIFIAMTDTCEEILHKIKQAPVHDETGLQLVFNPMHCIKCGMEIVTKDDEKLMCEYRASGALKWSEAIDYNKSKCHPKMLPVYTAKSMMKGILNLFSFKWKFSEEKCVNTDCKKGPGTEGCMNVHNELEHEGNTIQVQHSNKLDGDTLPYSIN